MNKATAIEKAGSVRDLAEILGISQQAVRKWKDGEVIPKSSLKLLRALRPAWFRQPAPAKRSTTTESKQ